MIFVGQLVGVEGGLLSLSSGSKGGGGRGQNIVKACDGTAVTTHLSEEARSRWLPPQEGRAVLEAPAGQGSPTSPAACARLEPPSLPYPGRVSRHHRIPKARPEMAPEGLEVLDQGLGQSKNGRGGATCGRRDRVRGATCGRALLFS